MVIYCPAHISGTLVGEAMPTLAFNVIRGLPVALSGGNNHGTIRRIHTIDRGSSIFQKRYAFNIFRIQPLKFAGTVSSPLSSITNKGVPEATDIDIGIKLTQASFSWFDPQTGNFSPEWP